MTSEKQIVANRRNALRSTGPQTSGGKRRSRRNALRHGLTAIAIVETIEAAADYEKFEKKINADYAPVTGVECALVARLVSLLWRLRRAVACESGLLQIHAKTLAEPKVEDLQPSMGKAGTEAELTLAPSRADIAAGLFMLDSGSESVPRGNSFDKGRECEGNAKLDLARSFFRLADSERNIFERIGRYEASLWRQTAQIICLLECVGAKSLPAANPRGRQFMASKRRAQLFSSKHFF